jgi:class 3 adenylate cyclase
MSRTRIGRGFYPDRRGESEAQLESGERRLGAIMFTDLVGYSAITSQDERRGLRLLEEHGAVLRKVFQRHGGVMVKSMGDGLLVEFASAVEAVNSAVEAQQALVRFREDREDKASVRARAGHDGGRDRALSRLRGQARRGS